VSIACVVTTETVAIDAASPLGFAAAVVAEPRRIVLKNLVPVRECRLS
jgi:hypothetical protein